MKRVLILAILFALSVANYASATEEKARFGPFGDVTLYYNTPSPKSVVIFISGDGGWNLGVVDMARELSSLDALVIGVDITHYLKELEGSKSKCSYPPGDFEELSKFAQEKLNLPRYITPVLVGYSSGATLVYATLVQAPSNTFKGGISLGFCPDLLVTKPFCKGSGLEWKPGPKDKGVVFLASKTLEVPWTAFQGTIDQVCDPGATEAYVKQVTNNTLVMLSKVGHGYSVPKNWMPQFKEAFSSLSAKPDTNLNEVDIKELEGLPLVEVPAGFPGKDAMAVLISGDGGWGTTEKGISTILAQNGIPVVGINSLHYFWKRRTPEGISQDLGKILSYYLNRWNKKNVVVIGYSMGADVAPFMISRLPEKLYSRVYSIVLMGPGHDVDLEFHLTNWIGGSQGDKALPVQPEVEKLKGKDIECIYGKSDRDEICESLPPGFAHVIARSGGHSIGKNYQGIADVILAKFSQQQSRQ